MTETSPGATPAPAPGYGRAGRDLRKAVASAVVLLAAIAASLRIWKPAFMVIVAAAVVVAVWELHQGFQAKGMDLPEQPLMLGGVVMVSVAYIWGSAALVTATAVTALVIMLWLLRRGIDGYVMNSTASVFSLVYVPFLGSFVALMLRQGGISGGGIDNAGVQGIITFVLVTIASDIGGQAAEGPGDLPEEVLGGLRRVRGLLRRGGLGAGRLPARRALVGGRPAGAD